MRILFKVLVLRVATTDSTWIKDNNYKTCSGLSGSGEEKKRISRLVVMADFEV